MFVPLKNGGFFLEFRCAENKNARDNLNDYVSSETDLNHNALTEQTATPEQTRIDFRLI